MTLLHQAAQKAVEALNHAQQWIGSAPHGDNCYVSDHYEGDPGDRCNCGKESALSSVERGLEALQQQPEPVGHVVVDMQSNGPGDRIKWTKLALEHGTPLYASHPAIQQPAFSVIDKVRDLRDVQGRQGLSADSYMRGLYNGLELALCTLEERDPIYAEKAALQHQEVPSTAVIPPAPPECETEDEKTAFAFGYWQGLHAARKGQEVPREPVATFRYEVQPDGESTYDVWLSDGMFGIKTPGDYPLYASPSTTRQQEAGSREVVAYHDKDQPNGVAWCPGYPEKLLDIVPLYAGERTSKKLRAIAAAPSTPENADGVGGNDGR